MRDAPENPTKRCGPHSVPTKVCPCCKVEKGIRSFAPMAKHCHDCRIAPNRPKLEGPTLTQREDARARAEVARFDSFAAQVRADACVPRSSSSRP